MKLGKLHKHRKKSKTTIWEMKRFEAPNHFLDLGVGSFLVDCGRIGHSFRDCDDESVDKVKHAFGIWLRAASHIRGNKVPNASGSNSSPTKNDDPTSPVADETSEHALSCKGRENHALMALDLPEKPHLTINSMDKDNLALIPVVVSEEARQRKRQEVHSDKVVEVSVAKENCLRTPFLDQGQPRLHYQQFPLEKQEKNTEKSGGPNKLPVALAPECITAKHWKRRAWEKGRVEHVEMIPTPSVGVKRTLKISVMFKWQQIPLWQCKQSQTQRKILDILDYVPRKSI